jgi:hypothetical protein
MHLRLAIHAYILVIDMHLRLAIYAYILVIDMHLRLAAEGRLDTAHVADALDPRKRPEGPRLAGKGRQRPGRRAAPPRVYGLGLRV